jgi:hypothetical protein
MSKIEEQGFVFFVFFVFLFFFVFLHIGIHFLVFTAYYISMCSVAKISDACDLDR